MLTRSFAAILLTVLLGVLLSLNSPPLTLADEIAGRASVIDGDTIEIAGKRIRLFGIDAPESRQTCQCDAKAVRCGQEAALALSDRLGSQLVVCDDRGRDRYGRIIAVCHLGTRAGPDINEWMIEEGRALAYSQYSRDYVPKEEKAKAGKRGIWSCTFEEPWEWRRQQRRQ